MKKLMIAAAVAAIASGAFAATDVCGGELKDDGIGYTIYKFNYCGKTTKGLASHSVESLCGGDKGCVARIPAKLKIKGWVGLCDLTCDTFMDALNAPKAQAFWELKPYKADIPDVALGVDVVNVIGKKPTKAEMHGVFTGTVTYDEAAAYTWALTFDYSGLGKYKGSSKTYKKIKGNFSGSPVASWYIGNGLKDDGNGGKESVCAQTSPYNCSTLQLDCGNTPNTVAFGKWTMKYSKSASKKFKNGKYPKTPSWATIKEG